MAEELGLKAIGVGNITIANGQTIQAKFALAYALMEGAKEPVSIAIGEGSKLAGIGLFTKFGYKVVVDCKDRIVELHKA